MTSTKECLNVKNGRNYPYCKTLVESTRPEWARYCISCGARRVKDWPCENPDKVKRYDKDAAVQRWRRRQPGGWAGYMRRVRAKNRDYHRRQNRKYVHDYRNRQKLKAKKDNRPPFIASLLQSHHCQTRLTQFHPKISLSNPRSETNSIVRSVVFGENKDE